MPLTLSGMLLGSIFMPERDENSTRPDFDFVGFALLAAAVDCLLTGLSNGQREGWDSDFVLGLFAIAATCGVLFVVWELHAKQPLVELRVLRNGQFTAAATAS